MTEKCSDFCQDDLADDDIMLLDNGQEVRHSLASDPACYIKTRSCGWEYWGHRAAFPPATCGEHWSIIYKDPGPRNHVTISSSVFSGLHVGWDPDKPSGDQAESEGLPGKEGRALTPVWQAQNLSVPPSPWTDTWEGALWSVQQSLEDYPGPLFSLPGIHPAHTLKRTRAATPPASSPQR